MIVGDTAVAPVRVLRDEASDLCSPAFEACSEARVSRELSNKHTQLTQVHDANWTVWKSTEP